MTVSKTTTQEKARPEETITMPLDRHISEQKNTAELQKENARLREALNRLLVVFVQRDLDTDDFDEVEIARAALSKERE